MVFCPKDLTERAIFPTEEMGTAVAKKILQFKGEINQATLNLVRVA
ncbi:MAG: hypothetical protein Ct9H300mP4_10170 [Gammaproteobacteria bacterium]|nr:MAG: hypothetical protein Ct9H300mP4_10170 [Gammaproteobacteria bacterium]